MTSIQGSITSHRTIRDTTKPKKEYLTVSHKTQWTKHTEADVLELKNLTSRNIQLR